MPDRYDQAIRALRDAPVPDQWNEITTRMGRTASARGNGSRPPGSGASAGPATGPTASGQHDAPGSMQAEAEAEGEAQGHAGGNGRSARRWPLALAVAASIAVVAGVIGAVAVIRGGDNADVSTGRPPAGLGTDDTAGTSNPPHTTTTPSTQTTTTTAATPPTGALPNEVVDIDTYPVSACRGLQFTATTPPSGIDGTMQPPAQDDPRVPSAVHGNLTGVFPSDTTTRAVFLVVGWPGLQDDGGTYIAGPFPGVQSWIAPYDEGWLAEIAAPATPGSTQTYCPFTVIGLGLDQTDLRQFLSGLALEG